MYLPGSISRSITEKYLTYKGGKSPPFKDKREAGRKAGKTLIIQNAVFLKILKKLTILSVTLQKLPSKF